MIGSLSKAAQERHQDALRLIRAVANWQENTA